MSVFTLAFPKINLSGIGAIEALINRLETEHSNEPGLLICDPAMVELGFANKILESSLNLTLFSDIRPNPTTNTVNQALDSFVTSQASYIIGLGGGSAIDTAKAIRILSANEGPISRFNGVDTVNKIGAPLYAINTTAGTAAEVNKQRRDH